MLNLRQINTRKKFIKRIFETEGKLKAQFYIQDLLLKKEINLTELTLFRLYLDSLKNKGGF